MKKGVDPINNYSKFVSIERKDSVLAADKVLIYPNPVKSTLTIVLNDDIFNEATIGIYNTGFGNLVFNRKTSSKISTINLSSLPTGLYTLTIQIDSSIITRKIIKE